MSDAFRLWLRARARLLCGGLRGRGKSDPIYVAATEHEHHVAREHYSSCGDLPQALAFEAGCRLPFVNRAEHEGWRPGRNLLDFYDRGPASPSNDVPGAGDFWFIWSDGGPEPHAFVAGYFVFVQGVPPTLETFNYGAGGMSAAEFPGARQSNTPLRERWAVVLKTGAVSLVLHPYGVARTLGPSEKGQTKQTGLWIGQRRLRYVLDAARLLELCEPELVPSLTGEEIDAIEAEADQYEQHT